MKSIFLFLLLTTSYAAAMDTEGDLIGFNKQLVIGEHESTTQDGSIVTTTVVRQIGKSDFTISTTIQKHSGAQPCHVPHDLIVVERLKQKANALVKKKMLEAFLDKQALPKKSKSLPSFEALDQ